MDDQNKITDIQSVSSDNLQAIAPDSLSSAVMDTGALALDPMEPSAIQAATATVTPGTFTLGGRLLKRADLILLALLIMGAGALVVSNLLTNRKENAARQTVGSEFGKIELPLSQFLATENGIKINLGSVTVNGLLQLNKGVAIAPSVQPNSPTAGQLYFDQNTSQLAYYSGTQFVPLGASGGVENLGGLNGQVAVGGGLNVAGGRLNNTGVLSLQGQTGNITLIAGNGIGIAGTTISNTGVVRVISASPALSVTNDGNGTITLTGSGAGTVSSPGGTAGTVPLFSGAQTIGDSIVTQSGGTLTVAGALNLGTALTVASGGTGATSLTAGGVLVGNGTSAISPVVAGGVGLCLISTAGTPTWGACSGGVSSLNGLTGALSVANASAAGSTITLNDATTAAKGIASFNVTNFSVSSGAVNTIQNIDTAATPTFAGVNTTALTPSSALTVGATTQTLTLQGSATTITANSGGSVTSLTFQTPTANVTYRLPTASVGTYDLCSTAGNCAGSGGGVTTAGGTTNRLAKFTGVQALGDSIITDNGTAVSVAGQLAVTGSAAGSITSTIQGAAGQTADLLRLQDSGGAVLSAFSPSGQLTLGRIAASGTIQAGTLTFADGTTDNFGSVLQTATLTASRTITLPDATGTICLQGASSCGFAGSSGSGSYIQNNATATPQSGASFNIDGRGIVGTGLGINNVSATNPLNVNAITTSNASTTSAQVLIGAGGTGNIGLLVQGAASRTVPLAQFQNSTGSSILDIGSSGTNNIYSSARIQAATGFDIDDSTVTDGNITKKLTAGTGGVTANDVVIIGNDAGTMRLLTTTTARDSRVYGIALSTVASGSATAVAITGHAQVTATSGAVAIGDQLVTSAVAGQVMADNNATTGILGIATTAKAGGSSGLVGVMIRSVGGVVNPDFQAGNLTTSGTIAAGTLTVSGAATIQGSTLTVGAISQQGSLVLHDGNGQTATISVGSALAANTALAVPTSVGVSDTFCLLTLANCVGTGGGVSGSGTNNRLAKFTSTGSTIGDSSITDNGASVTLATNVDLLLQGASAYISNPQAQTAAEAFGLNALVGSSDATAVGNAATSNGSGATALGVSAHAQGVASTSLGASSWAQNNGSIALGAGASTTAANQLVIGSDNYSGTAAHISDVYIGSGVTDATPTGFTLQGTGGSGSNVAGASVNYAAGRSTGSAAGGNLNLQISAPGSAGSSLNNLATVASLSGTDGSALFKNAVNSATAFRIQNATSATILTVDSATRSTAFTPGETGTVSIVSDLTAGQRLNTAFSITQANDAANNAIIPLVTISNGDIGSTSPMIDILQGASTATAMQFNGNLTSGNAIRVSGTGGNNPGGNVTFTSATSPFSGSYITVNPARHMTSGTGTYTESGNFLSLARTNFNDTATGTYAITGDLATLSSNCTPGTATCTDSSSILKLSQLYTAASGAVLNIQSAGTGNLVQVTDTTATSADVFTVANGGNATFKSQTNSTTAFRIQSASNASIFTADTTGSNLTLAGNNTPTITGWTTNGNNFVSNETRYGHSTVTANGYIYVIGGYDGSDVASTRVQYAKLNANGSIGTWATTTALPDGRASHASVTYNGYLYVIGGVDDTTPTAVEEDTVYYAKLNSDGTVGAWGITTTLDTQRSHMPAVMANGYIYVLGGRSTGGVDLASNVYAKINADGTLGNWTTGTAYTSSTGHYNHTAVVANGFVYSLGGVVGGASSSEVVYASLNANGSMGSWSTTNSLTDTRYKGAAVVANGYLYYLGGENTDNTIVQYAQLNASGTVSAWATTGSMNTGRRQLSVATANGYLYILGGEVSAAFATQEYASPSRILLGGSLDLLGLSGEDLANGSGGGSGGQLTAGNTTIVGTLTVAGNVSFKDGLSVGNALTVNGELNATSFSGAGLTDCDSTNSKLLWDATTKQFSCGTDKPNIMIRKASDESVTSSTAFQNDNDWSFSIGANETYAFQINAVATSSATGDFKFTINGPSGYSCRLTTNDLYEGVEDTVTACDDTTYTVINMSDSAEHPILIYGVVTTGGTGGTITFRWAQNVSSGTATIIRSNSYLLAYKMTGADLAEAYYTKDGSIGPGDVVQVDGSLKAGVKKTARAYDPAAIGIVSTEPGMVLGDASAAGQGKPVLLALNGRVPVRVSTKNGAIQPGDYLTASDIPGVAMKATEPGQVIGKALEAFSGAQPDARGTVMAFVNLSYYPGESSAQTTASDSALQGAVAGASMSDVSQDLQGVVKAHEAKIDDLQSRVAVLGATLGLPADELKVGSLMVQSMAVDGTLTVTGKSYLADVTLTGALNTASGTLRLQPLGNGGIDILDGKVVIDTIGNVTVKAAVSAKKLIIDTSDPATASIGEGKLVAGETSVTIRTTTVTAQSRVFVTAKTRTLQPLSVTMKAVGASFTVEVANPGEEDILFDWWVVN